MQPNSIQANSEQFEHIATLLDEQDSVILQLDQLNESIESLIDELAEDRKAELAEQMASDDQIPSQDTSAPESGDSSRQAA